MSEGNPKTGEHAQKERLVKAARMYAMCQKVNVENPTLQVSLALAAFEDMPLPEATGYVKTNRPALEDMAWAFRNSGSTEEFEQKLRERLQAFKQRSGRR